MSLIDVPLNSKLFKNVDETGLTTTIAALENCFITEANGLSRFPGLIERVDFNSNADMHLSRLGNDMVAAGSDGQTFSIGSDFNKKAIPGPPVLGGDRVSFARTRDGLMMAAGSKIIKYDGVKNSILSPDAPDSSFVGYLDGYVLAVEKGSGRFQHSNLNELSKWDPIDTFAVDGNPDNINAMLITPYGEILLSGDESVEQYERRIGSTTPFYRRWSSGEGISEPGTLCYADNVAWGLSSRYEFVRMSGQTSQSVSDDIQKEVENRYSIGDIGSLNKAWAAPCFIKGQKFIIFQAPEAGNAYGTKGFTAVFDIRKGRWFEIFGWDEQNGIPDIWPGKSIIQLWGKTFIGGKGKIYELSPLVFNNDGAAQRIYMRTAHYDSAGPIEIDSVRMTIKRGVGTYEDSPKIIFRSNPDNKGFGNYQIRDLGKTGADMLMIEYGAQGIADTWQFEIMMTDNAPFELRRLQVDQRRVTR